MPSSKRIRAERKRQLEKASEECRKDFFVKRTPNYNDNNRNNPHENNNSGNKNCRDDGPSNNNADDIHTGSESVQNKGDRPQSSSDVDFIVNVEGTEQLSCHDIANFEDTLNLDESTKYRILTGHFHPDDDFKFPKQFQHGCNRALNIDWLKKIPISCVQ